ncbi:saxitoxin and tetrodotoxin-binding protein 1-like isoform X2 [Sebastes fasciatus]|uniref:saxitoxin and tetrodotoxin-binding protein 1-like isoform X2 n=1 Tax=Sebastes fasciatus TaxID=394691 RepID=UPI003D9E9AD1
MGVVKTVMLLLLLAAIGTNADHQEGCDDLKMVAKEDLHKSYGHWVLVWAAADHQEGSDLLPNVSSSFVELHLLPDNNTVMFTERNLFLDKTCVNYFINMSMDDSDNHTVHTNDAMVEKDGNFSTYNESGDVDFYETCPDCLMMVYNSAAGRYLLNYRSEGHHQDVEQMKANQAGHQKHAKCLGFPQDNPFIYDGAADFCHKNSSAEVEATADPAVNDTSDPPAEIEATAEPAVTEVIGSTIQPAVKDTSDPPA